VSTFGSGHVGAIRFGPKRWTTLSENTRVRDNHNPAVPERSRRVSQGTRPALSRVRVVPVAKMRNRELVIQAESFLTGEKGSGLMEYPEPTQPIPGAAG
jgi:hypothetical protein